MPQKTEARANIKTARRRSVRKGRAYPKSVGTALTGPQTVLGDATGNGHHLIYPGPGTGDGTFRNERIGQITTGIYECTGASNEFINAPDLNQDAWTGISIVAWLYYANASQGNRSPVGLTGNSGVYVRYKADGRLDFDLGGDDLTANIAYTPQTWKHLACCAGMNGQPDEGFETFCDGVSINDNPNNAQDELIGATWILGQRDGGLNRWQGRYAQLLFFSDRLTLAQYQALYNAGVYITRNEVSALVEAGTIPAPEAAYFFGHN